MELQKFAAYDDLSIYAIADSPEAAIAQARADAGDPEARFSTAKCSNELAAYIEKYGWNGNRESFTVSFNEIYRTFAQR